MRRDNPEAGVRRIREEFRNCQGIGVSAETVRRGGINRTQPLAFWARKGKPFRMLDVDINLLKD